MHGSPILMPCLLEWSSAYLDYSKENFVPKTYLEKRTAFALLFKAGFSASASVESLTPFALVRHFQSQAGKRSGNAANKDRKNLAAAWSWGVKFMGLPAENPFLRVPRQSEERFPRRVPTLAEFWAVYAVATTGQDKRMLLLYLYSGARRAELFRLRWRDVDFEIGRIQLFTKKTAGGSWRADWVFLTEEGLQALREQQGEFYDTLDGFVFRSPDRGGPFQYRLQWLRRLCDRAGVPRFGFHGIRHLCASILASRGVPLPDIQAHLRHEHMTTTQRYIHSLQKMRAVLEALSGLHDKTKERL